MYIRLWDVFYNIQPFRIIGKWIISRRNDISNLRDIFYDEVNDYKIWFSPKTLSFLSLVYSLRSSYIAATSINHTKHSAAELRATKIIFHVHRKFTT